MTDGEEKKSLFRHITVPTDPIPRAPEDPREIKNKMSRHISLSNASKHSFFKRRKYRGKESNDQDEDAKAVG